MSLEDCTLLIGLNYANIPKHTTLFYTNHFPFFVSLTTTKTPKF